jgi:hypothetical protein
MARRVLAVVRDDEVWVLAQGRGDAMRRDPTRRSLASSRCLRMTQSTLELHDGEAACQSQGCALWL